MAGRAKTILLEDSTVAGSPGGALPDGGARPTQFPDSVVIIGNFDGVHRGHQAVLGDAARSARAAGLVAAVLTFDPHPTAVVGSGAPPALTTMPRRVELLARTGIQRAYVRRFDARFAAWSPQRFARELVSETLHAKIVMVGENFRFGDKRTGDLALLGHLGEGLGFVVRAHVLVKDDVGPLSSTRARMHVAAGDVEEAQAVLGRPHSLSGVVVHGEKRGRAIGFPTANLDAVAELLPPDGVYAVLVDRIVSTVDEERRAALGRGVMNIGVRPTVSGEKRRTIEIHLLDVAEDLYGATLRVHLVARLRDEMKFSGLDALRAQIARDVGDARTRTAMLEPHDGAFG